MWREKKNPEILSYNMPENQGSYKGIVTIAKMTSLIVLLFFFAFYMEAYKP